MAEITHLENPPITEALIDIRVKLPNNFDVSIFDSLNENELEGFPLKDKQSEYSANLKIRQDEPSINTRSKGTRGFIYKTEDKKNMVQFRRDGFTFNRLKPYTNWEDIIEYAQKLWHIYVVKSNPLKVTRIATRFINQVKLPLPINDFSEYMTAPPQNPSTDDQISGYLNRIKLFDRNNEIGTNLIQTLEKGTDESVITLLLDIDSFIRKPFDPKDADIWRQFEKLRIKKNQLFYSSLTKKAIDLHK